jgi:drug/metabolite transporter (DMT)-like permease
MAAMGLLSAPVGRVFMSTAARYITATEISLFSLSRTFLAPLMIWLIYAEMPGLSTFTGGVIILAALIFQSFSYDGSPSPKSLKTPAESGV